MQKAKFSLQVKSSLVLLKKEIKPLIYIGIENESDESKEKYIVLINTISWISFFVLQATGLATLILTENILGGFLCIITGAILLFAIYFNKKGRQFLAKIFMVCTTNMAVLLFSCLFEHSTIFASYYFSIITASYFLFSYNERKWLFCSIILSVFLYVMISSSLLGFIPYAYIIKNPERTNMIVLISHVLMIFLDLFAFLQVTKSREDTLVEKQNRILKSENQLKAQNEDLETFSIIATHSLQTPIYVSKFFLKKLSNNNLSKDALVSQQISIIHNCLEQMDQMVTGLFSYNEIINILEDNTSFNVKSEFENIKERMQEKYTNGLVITPAEGFILTTNRLLFSIIVQNLVDNGLKYNKSAAPSVTLSYTVNNTHVSVFVTDNGIGIEKEYYQKIFEPFRRINSGNHYIGTGLGLSGAKRAANRINGKLSCMESSKKGSVFLLDLPYTN